jgi:hypothetical protein
VAYIAPRGSKGLGQLGGLHRLWSLKEESRQYQPFHKAKAVAGQHLRSQRLKPACRPIHGKHGAFIQKCIDAHGYLIIIDFLNYSKQYRIIVVERLPSRDHEE